METMATKKQMIEEFFIILQKLIDQGYLEYYPFSIKKVNQWRKEHIQKGIDLYRPKIK